MQPEVEAKKWLSENNNKTALAGNRFENTQLALDFVDQLYQSGAKFVEIDSTSIYDEEWRIDEEGGPYADALNVYLPEDQSQRAKILTICNAEAEREGFDLHQDEGQEVIMLWWD